MAQMKEQGEKKNRQRTKQNRDSQPIKYKSQHIGDRDAQRTHWVWQHKERNEGYTKQNKEKSTGNQQWRGGSWDSNQLFGMKGRNKHSTRIERRDKNSKIEERLRNLWENFKWTNIWIIGVWEGEEEEQEIENLLEKNNVRKLPQFGEGNRHRGAGSTDCPIRVGPK